LTINNDFYDGTFLNKGYNSLRMCNDQKARAIENNERRGKKIFGFTVFEIATILLAISAVFVSIYSLGVSKSNSIALADYTMQQQISFDKHSAANQLSIEINSMNQSLQNYASAYMNYYDFSDELGKNIVIDPKGNSLLRVSDKSGNGTRLYDMIVVNGIFKTRKVGGVPVRNNGTLNMIYPPIDMADVGNKVGNETYYTNNTVIDWFIVVIDNPMIPSPLYNDHGMYYVYERDISQFDKNLSRDLYVFYNFLTIAETNRQYVQNYLDSHPNSKLNGQYFDAYMDMRLNIIYVSEMAPTILKELDTEKNS
jgi:hypothetical protein